MTEKLKVLIVDDDFMIAKTLKDILAVKGYEVEVANSGVDALAMVENKNFDCLLSDIKMPGLNGVELYKEIREKGHFIPTILMTAYSTDILVKTGLKEGVISVFSKPIDINMLLSFFSCLKKERSIAIVDDNEEFCSMLADMLRDRNFQVTEFNSPQNITDILEPDTGVILLDMKLNGANGLSVLKEVRKKYPHLPALLMTGYADEMAEKIEAAKEIDAYTCFYKPFQTVELVKVLDEIYRKKLKKQLGKYPE